MIHSLRRAARLALFGICLVGFAHAGIAWSAAVAPAVEEKSQEPAHELLYKFINFTLLVGLLVYFLRKPAADFFHSRSASIRKSLEEGRKALETSGAQLRTVEERLLHLEEEIAAFKASAEREMAAERQRLEQAAADEAARILEAAHARLDTALRAAKLELKNHVAQQAVTQAEGLIRERLDEPGRRRLVNQFVSGIEDKERKN
jgi:F-type H+-transporting ATPase subunit b